VELIRIKYPPEFYSNTRILHYIEPKAPGILIDSSAFQGCQVFSYFDKLLSKVIVKSFTFESTISY